ncbi:MAG TPA: secretion protein HlyD [Desulfotomaculum sp.]|nr:MAG: secretion protein HlyD [Desulfotomaculum sp. BICA1-6]HBX23379.1 secretion protein HlyD [Desulfotomaculum sp.]
MDKKKRIALVLVVVLLSAGGYWGYHNYLNRDSSSIEATGTIETTTVDLSAKIQGAIKTVAVKAGDTVSRGQLVAELSRNELVAQRERDALTVLKAEAALADLQSGARGQEIEEAALTLDTAKVHYEQASTDFKRLQTLYDAGAIPQSEYENAANRQKLTANQLEAAGVRLSLLESGSRPQQVNAARVEVERSKAVLKATEAVLEDLKVIALIDGKVLSRNYEVGEYVNPGTPVVTIADLSDMWIRVYIPTDDLPHVKLGQQVTFTVSGGDEVFTGIIEEIASKGEFTPKTIQTKQERANIVFGVKIRVQDTDGVLKPGMPADVVFGTKP